MTADAPPLVIRFGRLGDLVLMLPALGELARRHGAVDLVTMRQYAPLMDSLPHVRRVWSLAGRQGGEGLRENLALAASIREAGHGPVYDLHASIRSRLLAFRLPGPLAGSVSKQSLGRRMQIGVRVGEGRLRLAHGEVTQFTRRFLDAVGAGPEVDEIPRLPAAMCGRPAEGPPLLGLLPGARSQTKRWGPAAYGALAAAWRESTGGTAAVFHGPGEEQLAADVAEAAGGAADVVPDAGLVPMIRELGRCRVAVGGDTGLLHLAAAAGAAPVGLFGPTGVAMGYWPWDGVGLAITPDLPCHPCTLYGSERCVLGHHGCLADLTHDRVLARALELLGKR